MNPLRRAFLRRAGLLGAGAALLLAGCGRREPQESAEAGIKAEAAPGPERCDDLSGLTEDQIALRETFGYVETAPEPELECHHCEFYVEPAPGRFCGGCTLFPGPVHPEGFCDSFSEA